MRETDDNLPKRRARIVATTDDALHERWQRLLAAVNAHVGRTDETKLAEALVRAACDAFDAAGGERDPKGAARAVFPFMVREGKAYPETKDQITTLAEAVAEETIRRLRTEDRA